MPYELCRHIMTNGKRCESPALRGDKWCYFHNRTSFRHRANRSGRPKTKPAKPQTLLIPLLEDREAIQVALSLVVEAVALGSIDDKRAGILFRGLSIASRNAVDLDNQPYPSKVVREFQPTLDGLTFAERQMNDDSRPPDLPRPDLDLEDEADPDESD